MNMMWLLLRQVWRANARNSFGIVQKHSRTSLMLSVFISQIMVGAVMFVSRAATCLVRADHLSYGYREPARSDTGAWWTKIHRSGMEQANATAVWLDVTTIFVRNVTATNIPRMEQTVARAIFLRVGAVVYKLHRLPLLPCSKNKREQRPKIKGELSALHTWMAWRHARTTLRSSATLSCRVIPDYSACQAPHKIRRFYVWTSC